MFIRYQVQPIKGFVYESVRFSPELPATIVATVVPRAGSQARCSGCGRAGPTYDHAARLRVWTLPPLFKFTLALVYTMRRVKCPACGVVVEKVPWATGKHSLCDGFRLLLARWARKLSWDETADATFADNSTRPWTRFADRKPGPWLRRDWCRTSKNCVGRCSKTARTGPGANTGAWSNWSIRAWLPFAPFG